MQERRDEQGGDGDGDGGGETMREKGVADATWSMRARIEGLQS